jgi:hypothetical protein
MQKLGIFNVILTPVHPVNPVKFIFSFVPFVTFCNIPFFSSFTWFAPFEGFFLTKMRIEYIIIYIFLTNERETKWA